MAKAAPVWHNGPGSAPACGLTARAHAAADAVGAPPAPGLLAWGWWPVAGADPQQGPEPGPGWTDRTDGVMLQRSLTAFSRVPDAVVLVGWSARRTAEDDLGPYSVRRAFARCTIGTAVLLRTEQVGGAPADLRGADLSGRDLHGAQLAGAEMSRTNLTGSMLHGAEMSGAVAVGAVMRGANLTAAVAVRCDFESADLVEAVFDLADLRDSKIDHAEARKSRWDGADLSGASMVRTDLRGADMSGSVMRRVDMSGADVGGAVMPRTAS